MVLLGIRGQTMAVLERMKEWFAAPVTTYPDYECIDCGAHFEIGHEDCPECDGEVREFVVPDATYWNTMM